MNDNRQKIADRIRSLLAKTVEAGCTEAEALAAAELAGKLLDQYQLSMTDVELGAEEVVSTQIDTEARVNRPIAWCVGSIALYCNCRTWRTASSGNSGVRFTFFGLKSDVDVAAYLYAVIDNAMVSAWAEYRKAQGGRLRGDARKAFYAGMARRINLRLSEMGDERRAETKASTGRDLVLVKNAVVDAAFDALNMKLRNGRRSTTCIRDGQAYAAGQSAGDRVGLSRGVGSSGGPLQIAGR